VARFDAELYLRIAGEEMILGIAPPHYTPWESPLFQPASALVAVGALSAKRARAVIDDYALAQAVRSEEGHHNMHHGIAGVRRRRAKPKALEPRRVVLCDRTIEDAHGTLEIRHVTLAPDATSLAMRWRAKPSGQSRSRRHVHTVMYGARPGGPPAPRLTDDRGATAATHFSGHGSGDELSGHLTAERPLAPDTAWIEVDGVRIELTVEVAPCEVSIEPIPEEPAAYRFLWRRLAAPGHFHELPDIEVSIDALLAAGALERDDPVLSEIRRVREAMPDHPGMPSRAPGGTRALPEPWRSMLSRQGRTDGPEGTIALSAVTPLFDGFSVAIGSLDSHPEGFGIEADVAPGVDGGGPLGSSVEQAELTWWAADDRGNHYLGRVGGWSGDEEGMTAEISFWPALHPKARRLQIMPTAETTRAVITVPLPWSSRSAR
jgi:hypothetical protein